MSSPPYAPTGHHRAAIVCFHTRGRGETAEATYTHHTRRTLTPRATSPKMTKARADGPTRAFWNYAAGGGEFRCGAVAETPCPQKAYSTATPPVQCLNDCFPRSPVGGARNADSKRRRGRALHLARGLPTATAPTPARTVGNATSILASGVLHQPKGKAGVSGWPPTTGSCAVPSKLAYLYPYPFLG